MEFVETIIHNEPKVCVSEKILSHEDCDNMIQKCQFSNSLYPSAWLKLKDYPDTVQAIAKQSSTFSSYFENMNVIKYKSEQKHGPFYDAYDIFSERGKKYTQKYGQRVQTISICLGDSISIAFEKHDICINLQKGGLLVYDNVSNDRRQRDDSMEHTISNNLLEDTYLLNIYVREKDSSDNINPSFKLKEPEKLENKIMKHEDFMETLQEVFYCFTENKVQRNWNGVKSFTYNFKGDFEFFKKCVLEFNYLRQENLGLKYKNIEVEYNFDEFNPVSVLNVVSNSLLELLDKYYKTCIENNVFALGDRQSQRFKAHNEPMSRFLHYEILPLIEKIVQKKLMPTYTYLSAYINDSVLPTHTDRSDCEFTVSFLVNKDADWPIYLHKVKQPVKHKGRYDIVVDKDECIELHCQKGGLLIFSGTDHIHFREKFSGTYYNVLLLHYCSIEQSY